jgi:hypothetical protein
MSSSRKREECQRKVGGKQEAKIPAKEAKLPFPRRRKQSGAEPAAMLPGKLAEIQLTCCNDGRCLVLTVVVVNDSVVAMTHAASA